MSSEDAEVWAVPLLADSPLVASCQSPAHCNTVLFGAGKVSGAASVAEIHFPNGWDCANPTAQEGTTLP